MSIEQENDKKNQEESYSDENFHTEDIQNEEKKDEEGSNEIDETSNSEDDENQDDSHADSKSDSEDDEKLPEWVQQRIAREKRKRRQLEKRLESLESNHSSAYQYQQNQSYNNDYRMGSKQPLLNPVTKSWVEPGSDGYETLEMVYSMNQLNQVMTEEQKAIQEIQQRQNGFLKALDKLDDVKLDVRDSLNDSPFLSPQHSAEMWEELSYYDEGPEILYHLAKNDKEAEKLYGLRGGALKRAISNKVAQYKADKTLKQMNRKTTTKAPPATKSDGLYGKGSATGDYERMKARAIAKNEGRR